MTPVTAETYLVVGFTLSVAGSTWNLGEIDGPEGPVLTQFHATLFWHVEYSYCDEDLKFRGRKYKVTSVDLRKQEVEVRFLWTVSTWWSQKTWHSFGKLIFLVFFHMPKSSLNVPFVVELELEPRNAEPQTDP